MSGDMADDGDTSGPRPLWQRLAIAGGVLAAFVAAVAALGFWVTLQEAPASAERQPDPVPAAREVVYEMTGDGQWFSMTAETPDGTVQANPDLPLTTNGGDGGYGFEAMPGEFVYVSGQAKEGGRTLTCRILVDGVVIAENTSTGEFTIVTCKGTVPAN